MNAYVDDSERRRREEHGGGVPLDELIRRKQVCVEIAGILSWQGNPVARVLEL